MGHCIGCFWVELQDNRGNMSLGCSLLVVAQRLLRRCRPSGLGLGNDLCMRFPTRNFFLQMQEVGPVQDLSFSLVDPGGYFESAQTS